MLHADAPGLLAGAILLGVVHGAEPGHGWPIAAAYAMDRSNAWASGLAASLLIGIGHLISSIAVVLAFFATANWLDLHSLQEPIVLADGVAIGGPLGLVAGTLLIALGVREYRHGHAHSIGDSNHDHAHAADDHAHAADDHVHAADEHDHRHDHDHHHDGHDHDPVDDNGNAADNGSAHDHGHADDGGHTGLSADSGLVGIAWAAFVLGFAHEEEFEILALCTGSTHCLELMLAYALAVIVAIVALTLALVAGYQRFERRVEAIAPHFPTISAAVLIVMGLGFLLGIL